MSVILILLCLSTVLYLDYQNKQSLSNQKYTQKISPTPTPCYLLPAIVNPVSNHIKQLHNSYNTNTKRWPIVNQQLVSNTIEHGGIQIHITDSNYYTNDRINLLIRAIDIAPQILLNNRPQSIYLVTIETLNYSSEKALAEKYDGFTNGSNIYLFPHLFEYNNQSYISDILFHEWGHIIQYYQPKLLSDYLDAIGDDQGQTDYGKTKPQEDLSESISAYLTNQKCLISNSRVKWVEKFIGCN